MAAARLVVHSDEETIGRAKALFGEMGFDINTAINIFLRRAIAVNGLPFEVTRNTPHRVRELPPTEEELVEEANRQSYDNVMFSLSHWNKDAD